MPADASAGWTQHVRLVIYRNPPLFLCCFSPEKIASRFSILPDDRSADGYRLAGGILATRQFLNVKDTIKQHGSLCRCGYMMCEQFFK